MTYILQLQDVLFRAGIEKATPHVEPCTIPSYVSSDSEIHYEKVFFITSIIHDLYYLIFIYTIILIVNQLIKLIGVIIHIYTYEFNYKYQILPRCFSNEAKIHQS